MTAACVLGVATVVGVMISGPPGDGNWAPRMAPGPVKPVEMVHRHDPGSTRLPGQVASIRLEPVAADADSAGPDSLEDSDQIRAWARSNPGRAREWLASAPEGAKRETVSEMVCLQIAETNAAEAVALANDYEPGATNVLENLMMQWADQDLQAAYEWAAAKPPGKQRDALLSRIAFVESKTDPKDAATVVAQEIPPGPIQDEAAISVLYQWALKDPEAAMTWAQSFLPGTLHDRAVNEVRKVMASNSQSANAL
ncbi:MAG TPA: hypothetical protein VN873_13760 [Candidatus Angelobacter sp.]|nr:hypothetical protein [Candidatus Angelobacter sp.]